MQIYVKMFFWLCASFFAVGTSQVQAQPTPMMKQFSQFPGGPKVFTGCQAPVRFRI
jgi:hypothetical protein